MSTLDSLLASIGLLWERFHLITSDTVQTAGVTSTWTQNLEPIGSRVVAAGELVELHVSLEHDHVLPPDPGLRFDILEFDWLFSGGFDDPVSSLTTPGAPAPTGDFTILERLVSESDFTGRRTLRDVVDAYRIRHADDYEKGVLVVRETDLPESGRTHVIAWWRTKRIDEADPSLYFVAEIPGLRDSSTAPLKVGPAEIGANVRLFGRVLDSVPAAADDAQAIPGAIVTLRGGSALTSAEGDYVIDAHLPLGTSPMTIARPGVDSRRVDVRVAQHDGGGFDITLTDADAAGAILQTAVVATDVDDQDAVPIGLDVRALVHRLSGTVTWPDTRVANPANVPLTLVRRRVYALPLTAGATLAQRPRTSREWSALRHRPDVLRSAVPDRPTQDEPTGSDGRFEISFVDLRPGSQYLLWVAAENPRDTTTELPEVIVRTLPVTDVRAMNGDHANTQSHTDRRLVDTTSTLLGEDVSMAFEVIRVVNTAAVGAPPVARLVRTGRGVPAGVDAQPMVGAETITLDTPSRRATGLVLEALPLLPVFEPPDQQSSAARWATRTLHEQLDRAYLRGHLRGQTRWVLDARRSALTATAWASATNVGLLEQTMLTHPDLPAADLNNPDWRWWRIDAVTLADFAGIALPAGAGFATRTLSAELVPVLRPPAPWLPGLFGRRHLMVSPGHGLFAQPPLGATPAEQLSARGGWAQFAGEDENTAIVAIEVARVVRANGARATGSREMDDLREAGVIQTAANAFAASTDPDFPRLWQQNAYYWFATRWDPANPTQQFVLGAAQSGSVTTPNGATDPNSMRKNVAGISARMAFFRALAADPVAPVDAFVAIHTNGGAATAHGTETIYLDIRPTSASPAPGAGGYREANALGLRFATLLQDAILAACHTNDRGERSYFANGNPIGELRDSVTHFRAFTMSTTNQIQFPVQAVRSLAPDPALNALQFPRRGSTDVPVGYVEVAFHSHADDVLRLAQHWFRRAAGVAVATASEAIIREHPDPITGDDLKALLTRAFGATTAIVAMTGGSTGLGPADVVAAVAPILGAITAPASAALGPVVAAVEAASATVTRARLVDDLSRALARVAGFDPADPNQADDIARAALAPMLAAAGADALAADVVPALAGLPRGTQRPTRADVAGFVGAGLGLTPATPARVGQPINGVVVFPAVADLDPPVRDAPDAFLSPTGLTDLMAQAARLRPVDVHRLVSVVLTDARGNVLPVPARVLAGTEVRLSVRTSGTAWRAAPAEVEILATRVGVAVATLACETRTTESVTSAVWSVPVAAGATGRQTYSVSLRIRHAVAGRLEIGPVTFDLEVATVDGGGPR